MLRRIRYAIVAVTAALLLAAGCSPGGPASSASPGATDKALTVYATTGYIADAVANIAPNAVVTTMVGPGGDPHTHQPSTKDIQAIRSADVVLWNGLHLEAQMLDLLSGLGNKQLAVAEKLPHDMLLPWPEKDEKGNALHDPHVWNSPDAWSLIVGHIADKLAEIDPKNADTYRKNAEQYQNKIKEAAKEAEAMLSKVPAPRILITGHDAFNYFGKTYNLKVHATDFVSTEAKLSAEELSQLAHLIADNKVPVIFQDNQANPQAITSLKEAVHALGWDVVVSGKELYADSLGTDPDVNTYLGVFRHNAKSVADALGGNEK